MKCKIEGCEETAKYQVEAYGVKTFLCWKHLKEKHTPNNDDNVKVISSW